MTCRWEGGRTGNWFNVYGIVDKSGFDKSVSSGTKSSWKHVRRITGVETARTCVPPKRRFMQSIR
jgi:hypothetical protein